MHCPVWNVDLLIGERLTVQIDYCPKCRGIWLAHEKRDKLLENTPGSMGKNTRRNNDNEGGVGGFPRGSVD